MFVRKIIFLALSLSLGGCPSQKADPDPPPPDSGGGGASMTDAAVDQTGAPSSDLATSEVSGNERLDTNAPVPATITEGPYAACQDFEAMSPTTG